MLAWAAAYATFVLVAATFVFARREPTVIRGEWVLLANAAFVLAAVITTPLTEGRLPPAMAIAGGLLIAFGWLARRRWTVVGAGTDAVAAALEECGRRLCAEVSRAGPLRWTVTIPGEPLHIRLTRSAAGPVVITFESRPRHRKAELFRSLLAKQYHRVLPTIRIGARP